LLVEARRLVELGWTVDATETRESINRREQAYTEFTQSTGCRFRVGMDGARDAYELAVLTHVLEFVEDPHERVDLLTDVATRLTDSGLFC
jgi:hypothetical protein